MDLTLFGHPQRERDGAPGGVRHSGVVCERTPRLWQRVLRHLQEHGPESQAIVYLDLDTSHDHGEQRLRGRHLRERCKAAFFGRAALPLAAVQDLGTLPPFRPHTLTFGEAELAAMPPLVRERALAGKSVEGIGVDGDDAWVHGEGA